MPITYRLYSRGQEISQGYLTGISAKLANKSKNFLIKVKKPLISP